MSRGTPRRSLGYRYRVLRSLAPNDHTWAQEDQGEFEQAYIEQLEALGAQGILGDLRRISEEHGGKALCLLCWERLANPDEYCHRLTLSRWLKKQTGVEIGELQPGNLPMRLGSAQPRLFDGYREEKR